MQDLERKHKIRFGDCMIIPKPDGDFDDDASGHLSFDGYAIMPRAHYEGIIKTVRTVAKALKKHDQNHRDDECFTCVLRKKLETVIEKEESDSAENTK